MEGTVQNEKKLVGTLSTGASVVGGIGTVFGKDGKSAYEVALANGFEGTEAEWLESLRGVDGDGGYYAPSVTQVGIDAIAIEFFPSRGGMPEVHEATIYLPQGERGERGYKGDKGDKGDAGNSGVYLGSGDMPDDYNVQIDPDGDAFTQEQLFAEIHSYIDEQLGVIENGTY